MKYQNPLKSISTKKKPHGGVKNFLDYILHPPPKLGKMNSGGERGFSWDKFNYIECSIVLTVAALQQINCQVFFLHGIIIIMCTICIVVCIIYMCIMLYIINDWITLFYFDLSLVLYHRSKCCLIFFSSQKLWENCKRKTYDLKWVTAS